VDNKFSSYDAAKMLVEASRPGIVQRLRRNYVASYNENCVLHGS
jgi:hypothetical protein